MSWVCRHLVSNKKLSYYLNKKIRRLPCITRKQSPGTFHCSDQSGSQNTNLTAGFSVFCLYQCCKPASEFFKSSDREQVFLSAQTLPYLRRDGIKITYRFLLLRNLSRTFFCCYYKISKSFNSVPGLYHKYLYQIQIRWSEHLNYESG